MHHFRLWVNEASIRVVFHAESESDFEIKISRIDVID